MREPQKILFLLLLVFVSGRLQAQDLILDNKINRFLINQKSDKPRLDVIVQGFTNYEKNVVSKQAVMDTTTKPAFEKVSETEYNVTASRMGEKLTFVVRDYDKLNPGFVTSFTYGKVYSKGSSGEVSHYILNAEKCAASSVAAFGKDEVVIKLSDNEGMLLFKLNVKFTYPRPQLYYVDMMAHFDLTNTPADTTVLRKFTKWISPEPHKFTSEAGGVPVKVVREKYELNFGFKPAYYDGSLRTSSVTCKIDNSAWRGTGLMVNPYTYIYYHLRKDFDWLNNGQHILYARYGGENAVVLKYEFEVKNLFIATSWHWVRQFIWLIFMMAYRWPWLMIIIFGLILYLIFKRKIKRAREEAKKINLELQAIQAQLNPHFIFNAMSSIQGLVNKNEIEKANTYLTDFSKLLRNSLNNNKEMIPLSEELRSLDSYVRLEKLRFNFQYKLHVDENIETSNVEIPSLLIQPLIENAIKHGISGLNEMGLLNISFTKSGNDLVVEVKDNGKGFNGNKESAGQGIRLTRERIKLLNKSKNKIQMNIESDNGTVARLILKHAF